MRICYPENLKMSFDSLTERAKAFVFALFCVVYAKLKARHPFLNGID